MGWYVILCNLTEAGVNQTIRGDRQDGDEQPLDPVEALRAAVEFRGGTLHSAFWTLGIHDLVATVELQTPDDVGAVVMALGNQGALRTTTLTAIPGTPQYTEVLRLAHEIDGHLRGGVGGTQAPV